MNIRFLLIIVVIALFMSLGANSFADQETQPPVPGLRMGNESARRIDTNDQMRMVRQFMSRGAYISAADLLENMFSEDPTNREVADLLLSCYDLLKAYPKAEMLLKRQLESNPYDYSYHERLLDIYLRLGVDSVITRQMNNIFDKFPGNPDIYRSVISRLVNYGYNDRATDLIEKGRQEFGNDHLFSLENASILEIKGDYYKAVMEYLTAVHQDTLLKQEVDRKLSKLIRYPDAPDKVIAALNDVIDTLPGDVFASSVLQEAYMTGHRYQEAFDVCIRVDSLTEGDGRQLMIYLRRCYERKLYDQVIKVANYIERRDFNKDIISEYRYYYADALAKSGRPADAILVYKEIKDTYPQRRDQVRALLEMGKVFRYQMQNYDSAGVYFDSVINIYHGGSYYVVALDEIATMYMAEGKLDSAEAAYNQLGKIRNTEDMLEKISYNLAMIDLFRKNYNKADTAFRRLITSYPRGFYINDALINSLTIRESQLGYPEALDKYVQALYYRTMLKPDSVEKMLQEVIDMGNTPLIGQSSYTLAEYYIQQSDTIAALNVIDDISENYPDDYFYPYCLKLRADIYARGEATKDRATEIYKSLLEKFNTYPFIGETREALQRLESDQPPS